LELTTNPSSMQMMSRFKVFRKASPNDKISVFLFTRNFYDDTTSPPIIDGLIKLDPNYVSERNVYMQMVMIFGRKEEDLECQFEHAFSTKKLYLDCHQVYPITREIQPSKQQADLIAKLGSFTYPFRMEFPQLGAPSYQMMQGLKDEHSQMGLEYEIMAFVGKDEWDDKKRSTARIAVWRIQSLPPTLNLDVKPKGHKTKNFLMYNGSVHIDVLLNKNVYRAEDEMTVYVNVYNNCNKPITEVKIKIVQRNQIPIFVTDGTHDATLQKLEDKVHLSQGKKLTRDYTIMTNPPSRKMIESYWKKTHVMLEGTIGRDGKEVLAASTHINPEIPKRDLYGIYVEYVVKVKATFGHIPGDTICEVPFILTQNRSG